MSKIEDLPARGGKHRRSAREQEVLRQFSAPRWIWWAVSLVLGVVLVVETILIFFVFSPEMIDRLITTNGLLVMTGGLMAFTITTMTVMFPLKWMTVYMLALYESLVDTMVDSNKQVVANSEKMARELERVSGRLEEVVESKKPIPARRSDEAAT